MRPWMFQFLLTCSNILPRAYVIRMYRRGDSRQPCLIPLEALKKSVLHTLIRGLIQGLLIQISIQRIKVGCFMAWVFDNGNPFFSQWWRVVLKSPTIMQFSLYPPPRSSNRDCHSPIFSNINYTCKYLSKENSYLIKLAQDWPVANVE